MGNADSQFVALAVVPKITASISIPCQIWIIKEVIADHLANRGKATSRALLGMGVVDVMASFGWFLSTWAAPANTEGVPFASGTTGSCTFQGFLLQLAIGAPMYNFLLALYYLLNIRYGWSDARLRRLEWVMHSLIILFAVGTGIALIPMGMYNHIGAVCWTMGLPQGCGNSNYTPGNVPCKRGNYAWIYGISLFYGPLWVCIVLTTAAMILIYKKVRIAEARSSRYAGGTGRTKSKDVFMQALLYTVSFYVTWAPSTIWSITQWFDKPMFWLDLLATICEPSQGLFNMLVFIRPRKDLQEKLKHDALFVLTCGMCRRELGSLGTFSGHSSSSEGMRHSGHNKQSDTNARNARKAEYQRGGNRVSLLNTGMSPEKIQHLHDNNEPKEGYPQNKQDGEKDIDEAWKDEEEDNGRDDNHKIPASNAHEIGAEDGYPDHSSSSRQSSDVSWKDQPAP